MVIQAKQAFHNLNPWVILSVFGHIPEEISRLEKNHSIAKSRSYSSYWSYSNNMTNMPNMTRKFYYQKFFSYIKKRRGILPHGGFDA